MRYFLILIVLIMAVGTAMFTVPMQNGKPLLDWQHVEENWQDPDKLIDEGVDGLVGKTQETTLYRWRDPRGNWQYARFRPRELMQKKQPSRPASLVCRFNPCQAGVMNTQ